MTGYHRLGPDDLAALSTGLGGGPVVRELCTAQLSRHLLLLKYVSERWPIDRTDLDAAVATLAQAQRADPATYAELLGAPLVGAWLATTTRRLRGAQTSAVPLAGDLLRLGALAAAAAVRLGLDCAVTGYARQGLIFLPATGTATVAGRPDGPVPITVAGGHTALRDAGWQAHRRLTARHDGLALTVDFEDGDPYRDGYHVAPRERLDDAEFGRWQDIFAEAWELIVRYLPARATELAAGLRAFVPLVDDSSGAARSGTARDSVGAVGLTRPRSAADLAVTVVHEFQHSKLTAALELVQLYRPDGSERHFAPWRVDPRPTAGLIQGVYAFLGVADAWLALRAAPHLERVATEQSAIVREQVRVGLAALDASTELTALGRHFTAGMRGAVDRLFADRLPVDAVRRADSVLTERRAAWQHRLADPASQPGIR